MTIGWNNVLSVISSTGTLISIVNRRRNEELTLSKANETRSDLQGYDLNKVLSLDVLISTNFSSEMVKTSNPTQLGVSLDDHAYRVPRKMVVRFGSSDLRGTWAQLKGIYKVLTNKNANSLSRSQVILQDLLEAQERKILLTLDDGLQVLNNLLITNITYDRSKENINGLIGSIELEEVIYINQETQDVIDKIPVELEFSTKTNSFQANIFNITRRLL